MTKSLTQVVMIAPTLARQVVPHRVRTDVRYPALKPARNHAETVAVVLVKRLVPSPASLNVQKPVRMDVLRVVPVDVSELALAAARKSAPQHVRLSARTTAAFLVLAVVTQPAIRPARMDATERVRVYAEQVVAASAIQHVQPGARTIVIAVVLHIVAVIAQEDVTMVVT